MSKIAVGLAGSLAAILGASGLVALPAAPVAGGEAASAAPVLKLVWQDHIADGGGGSYIALSSPNVATLTGGRAVVVGDMSGHVYAFHLATGSAVSGWPRSVTGGVTSTPSVAAIPGTSQDTILVGSGNATVSCTGGYQWLPPDGRDATVIETNPSTDTLCAHSGVQASMAVGTLQGTTAAVAGSLGQETYAFDVSNREDLPGFPWYQADSDFATSALAALGTTGTEQIVAGGASTAGSSYGKSYTNGGHIRILTGTGQLVCEDTTDEAIDSSPAVGRFLAGTGIGIVAGTGPTYPDASQRDQILAVNTACAPVWSRTLNGTTGVASPALADVLGNGSLQVVVTTRSGGVWALDGSTGSVIWHTQLRFGIIGSPVTAALGDGQEDVIVGAENGFDVLTGASGAVLVATVATTTGFENAPLVTEDANGTIGITLAGHHTDGSTVSHYEIATSDASNVDAPGTWPQFHHDPQLTGDASESAPPPPFATATRIYGATPDATAGAELEHQFPATGEDCPGVTSTRPVVLATDHSYPDALASAYLARALGTGTLLTSSSSLSPVTGAVIEKEGVTHVFVVGGPLALSTAVVHTLESTRASACGGASDPGGAAIKVTRIAGPTEYDTAQKIAEYPSTGTVGSADLQGAYSGSGAGGGPGMYNTTAGNASAPPSSPSALRTAILATGKGFQDAEAASTLSYAARLPILLTTPSSLSAQVQTAISDLGIAQVIVMGGQYAVSDAVVASLESLGVFVLRVAGDSYTGTAVELAGLEGGSATGGDGFGWAGTRSVTVARGDFYTDGLAGAIVAADGPSAASPEPLLLTVDPTTVGSPLTSFLETAGRTGFGGAKVTSLVVLGGPYALTQTTVDAMGTALRR